MKQLVILILSFVVLGGAHVSAQQASSLQNQSSSSVQGNSSNVQNTNSQIPQGTNSLNQLTSSGTTVPLSTSSTTTQAPSTPTAQEENSTIQKILIGLAILGALLAGIIVWGIADSRKVESAIALEETVAPTKPKAKKKKPKTKRKKAHR